MFKQTLIASVLILIATIAFLGFRWGILTDEQRNEYQELMALSQNQKNEQAATFKQYKNRIQKDIYVNDAQGRLHIRVIGDKAEMCCQERDHEMEIVEKLEHVRCFMQEHLYEEEGKPMQILRVLDAEQAEYHYNDGRFVAEKVKMCRYLLPGHELIEPGSDAQPLISGTAERVTFSLDGDNPNFQAENFHGQMDEGISL